MNETSTIYSSIEALSVFEPAIGKFQRLMQQLSSKPMQQLEHGELERLIQKEGTEVLRWLLQGHLDLRTQNEIRLEGVTGDDQIKRTHRRSDCSRNLMTLFGEVTVRRIGYSARGCQSIYPMDSDSRSLKKEAI